MHDITPKQFLQTLFDQADPDDEIVVACHEDSFMTDGEERTFMRNYDALARRSFPTNSWYYCVSTASPLPGGKVKRTLANLVNAHVLVCDDIGTKATPPPLVPSYVVETSPDNYQWGYRLVPWDVSTHRGAVYYDSCLYGLIQAGHNDPGCRSASRVVRLPGSLHQRTGFRARVVEWRPDGAWHLEALMETLGVEPVRPPRSGGGDGRPGKHKDLEAVSDPILDFLYEQGMVLSHDAHFVFIQCPWRDSHTDGKQGGTSTAFSPLDYDREGRQFRCLHGHCADRYIDDLVAWVAGQGAVDLTSTSTGRRGPFGD